MQYHAGGIPIVARRKYFGLLGAYDRIYYLTGDNHAAFVGSTGRGKSETIVKTMINSYIDAGESYVVNDMKKDLFNATAAKAKAKGYNVICLDFTDPKSGSCWNPLDLSWSYYRKALSNRKWYILNEQKERIDTVNFSVENKSIKLNLGYDHSDSLQSITYTATLLNDEIVEGVGFRSDGYLYIVVPEFTYKVEVEIKSGDTYKMQLEKELYGVSTSEAMESILDVANALTHVENSKDKFWDEGAAEMITAAAAFLMENGDDRYINFKSIRFLYELGVDGKNKGKLQEYMELFRSPDSDSRIKFATYFSAEGVAKGNLKSVFNQKVALLTATEEIMEMTSSTSFDFNEICNKKTAIYIVVHDEKSTYHGLVALFFKQFYEVAIKQTRLMEGQRFKVPVNFILDEFAMMPAIKDIQRIFAAARSRGVRINIFYQSPQQLEEVYGKNEAAIIWDNCNVRCYLGSNSYAVKEYFSKEAGSTLRYSKKEKKWIKENLLSPEKLSKFQRGKVLFLITEKNPIVTKLPMYSQCAFAKQKQYILPIEKRIPKPVEYFNLLEDMDRRLPEVIAKGKRIKAQTGELVELDEETMIISEMML